MPHRRLDAEHIKEFRARFYPADTSCARLSGKSKIAITINRDPCQGLVLIAKVEKIRIRKRTEHALIFLAGIGDPESKQLLWLRKRKRLEQKRVNYAENCGVRPDAEREGKNRNQSKGRRLCQHPEGKSDIVHENLLGSQGNDWVDPGRSPGREPGRQESCDEQERADGEINSGIDPPGLEENALQRARKQQGRRQPNGRPDQKQLQPMGKNERSNLCRARAKCETNTDFTDAFERGIGEQSVKPDSRKH